jgi:hypothetical protein
MVSLQLQALSMPFFCNRFLPLLPLLAGRP